LKNKKIQWHIERNRSSKELFEVIILMQAMLRVVEGNSFLITQAIALMLECAKEEYPKEGIVLKKLMWKRQWRWCKILTITILWKSISSFVYEDFGIPEVFLKIPNMYLDYLKKIS